MSEPEIIGVETSLGPRVIGRIRELSVTGITMPTWVVENTAGQIIGAAPNRADAIAVLHEQSGLADMLRTSEITNRIIEIEERAKQAGGKDQSDPRTPANDVLALTATLRRLLFYANRIEAHADTAIGGEESKRHADGIRAVIERSLGGA